jgi:WD40 repeat protein
MTDDEALVVVDSVLGENGFNNIQELVFRRSWEDFSYAQIAEQSSYDAEYIKQIGGQVWQLLSEMLGQKVSKKNFRVVLQRYAFKRLNNLKSDDVSIGIDGSLEILEASQRESSKEESLSFNLYIDWGEAMDVQSFYGRERELERLSQWIDGDRCRIVAILGMGGIGKTALTVKLAEQAQHGFDYAIWVNLRDAPPISSKMRQLISFLSNQQQTDLPASIEEQIACLMEYLRKSRCLLIFDNFESVLRGTTVSELTKHVGQYREGYEDYGQLLRRIGESPHQSCLILTSREEPRQIARMKGTKVQPLFLKGLATSEAKSIFQERDKFQGSDEEWQQLVTHYAGNPLALKMVASLVQNLLGHSISRIATFLGQGTFVFDDIRDLLDRQLDRLSEPEIQVMYWLAIAREVTTVAELQADLFPPKEIQEIFSILDSLRRRSLIETIASIESEGGFTQQPVVMEYVTDKLIERICNEIVLASDLNTSSFTSLKSYALIKATAKDYIRESQIRLILEPLIRNAIARLGSKQLLIERLNEILQQMRSQTYKYAGYEIGNILNLAIQLDIDLTDFNFSYFTIRQAYLKIKNLHNCNFTNSSFKQCVFAETFGSIVSIAFSRSGRLFATSDSHGELQVWQAPNWVRLITCGARNNDWIWSLTFSPNERILASCGFDHTIKLWDIASGECIKVLSGHGSTINCTTFIANGQILASGSDDATIKLWDVETGECLKTLCGHESCIWAVTLSPDGQTIASGSQDRSIKLWDVETGKCHKTWEAHSKWVRCLCFSHDGKTLFSGSFDRTVKQWDVLTGELIQTLQGHSDAVIALDVSPGGQIATSGYDRTIRLWDADLGQCIKTLQGHTSTVWSVAFSPDGKILASGGDDYAVKLWEVASGQCVKTMQGHSNSIYRIALHPNYQLIASSCEDQTVKIWDVGSGDEQTLRGHAHRVLSVAFSPNGEMLASSSADRTVKLWNWRSGKCLKTLAGHVSWVWLTIFSPDSKVVASSSYDSTIGIWDADTGECLRVIKGHNRSVLSIAFNCDGKHLLSSSDDHTLKLWEVTTGQCIWTVDSKSFRIWSVNFSPDGATFVTSGSDRTIKLWSTSNGECLSIITGSEDEVLSASFSQDGNMLVSSSVNRTIKLWDISSGQCIKTFHGHGNWVWSSLLMGDGKTIVSASGDETIKIWDVETGECLKTLRSPRPYEGMNITGIQGLNEAQIATLKALGAIEGCSDIP